jgi:hypothetical protein
VVGGPDANDPAERKPKLMGMTHITYLEGTGASITHELENVDSDNDDYLN